MIPTWRVYGLLLGAIAIAALIAALGDLRTSIIAVIAFDVVVLALMAIDSWRVRSQRVTVARQPLRRLSIGRDNTVHLTVQTGKRPAELQIRDGYPEVVAATPPILTARLPAQHSEELTYSVRPSQRGEFAWGAVQVRQRGPWGLAWHDWSIPQPQAVAVYPDLLGLRSLSLKLTLQSAGSIRQSRRFGMGTEFAELRNYSQGDDPRLIDWKATARRAHTQDQSPFLVRVLEPEQEQTLLILLDRGRLMTAQVQGLKRFDWALNAALSLATAGLHRGDRVGIAVFDREITTWIPPERGIEQLPRFIERLTPLQPVLLEPDYLSAVTTIVSRQTRRALVVLLTDLVDQTASGEVLSAMGRLAPRYLPFCVALRDPRMDEQAHTTTQSIEAAYARAVALDLLAQRQVALASLKQRGGLVLDAPAHQVTDQLVEQYLRLKARNQL